MKQNKLLWGTVVCLATAVLILLFLLQRAHTLQSAPPTPIEPQKTTSPDPVIATIGDRQITSGELGKALLQKHGAELLGQMLDRAAIQMEADELGITLSDSEIDAELKRMMQGYDSEEQFYNSMKEQLGMTKDAIHEDVQYKLLLDKIATRNVTVTDQEIDAYIQTHPEEFKSHVQLHLQQIVNQTLEQAQRSAELARGGSDFAELARNRSIDTATANDGGDLGWVEEDDPFLPAAVMKAAKQMKPGDISDPIPLDKGYAVIYLKDRKEDPQGNRQEIRDSVRKQLALQKAPSLKDVVKQLREKYHAAILDPSLKP